MFQGSSKSFSRKFQGNIKCVSKKGSNRFEEMSRVFEISVKGLSGKFQGSLKTVSRES